MCAFVSLSSAAESLGVPPKVLSDMIWLQLINPKRCKRVGFRRFIPVDYLPEIRELLIVRGKLPASRKGADNR